MVTVIETRGWPRVFNLADGTSMRLLPNERKSIKKSLVSDEITAAVSMGLVSLAEEVPEIKPAVTQHTESSNKSASKKKDTKQEV